MKFLAVNYHYFSKKKEDGFGIYPTSISDFKAQLLQLGRDFSFISQNELIEAIDGVSDLPEKSCLITFDDGLRSQYEQALPVIDVLGIPAVFFVNTLPYINGKLLSVHKIHWCRHFLSPKKFITEVCDAYNFFTGQEFNQHLFSLSDDDLLKQYRYDDLDSARIKFALNNALEEDLRNQIINVIFKKIINNERSFCRDFYINRRDLKKLYKRGYLGTHTHSHQPLASFGADRTTKEIVHSLDSLADILTISRQVLEIRGISYPYGNSQSVSPETGAIAKSLGLKFGFTMERSLNSTLQEPLLLARVDTNDVIGGKKELLL